MHHSRAFDALGWAFRVASDDGRIVEHVDHLYRGLADAPHGETNDYVVRSADDADQGYPDAPLRLTFNGDVVDSGEEPARLVTALVHDVNRRALDSTSLLAAHAGGVACGDAAVVLPAHMESGKTTLTAGLVRAGFAYFTDEAVAFEWETGAIVPYAKPLSIDEGSWPLFEDLEPDIPFAGPGHVPTQWQVPADAIRPDAYARHGHARYLVFPKYDASARTELLLMTRGEALVELAKNTFRFREHGRRALTTLAGVVEQCECYRMPVGDLAEAVAQVEGLVAT
jgi:hypothetical protein